MTDYSVFRLGEIQKKATSQSCPYKRCTSLKREMLYILHEHNLNFYVGWAKSFFVQRLPQIRKVQFVPVCSIVGNLSLISFLDTVNKLLCTYLYKLKYKTGSYFVLIPNLRVRPYRNQVSLGFRI